MQVRPTAVAGLFYPADRSELNGMIEALLAQSLPGAMPDLKGLIVPHAGYPYSGAVAASAYHRLAPRQFRDVLLLAPAHRVPLRGIAASSAAAFATPLGILPLSPRLKEKSDTLTSVHYSDEAHADEHAIEVQLPFLQHVLGEIPIWPLLVGHCSPVSVAHALRLLADTETLILVSSDLSHYQPYWRAVDHDEHTIAEIEAEHPLLRGEDACGAYPLNGLLALAHERHWQVECIDYRNSGDTAGNRDRVVGYGSFVVH
jgi:AmmeMemoRadiSam system protein B